MTPQKSVARHDLTVGTLSSRGSNSISQSGFFGTLGARIDDLGRFDPSDTGVCTGMEWETRPESSQMIDCEIGKLIFADCKFEKNGNHHVARSENKLGEDPIDPLVVTDRE